MSTAKRILALLVPVAVALAGALAGSPVVTGTGVILVYGVLAFQDPAVPRPTRLLLRAGLLFLAVAQVGTVWVPATVGDEQQVLNWVADPANHRVYWYWQLLAASAMLLACVCLAAAIARIPREPLDRVGLITPLAAGLILLASIFLDLLTVGRSIETAFVPLVALAACALVAIRILSRHGIAAAVGLGAGTLAVVTYSKLSYAWYTRPSFGEPVGSDVRIPEAARQALDIDLAVAVAVLLTGAIVTVLTCARLNTPESAPA
ncbi:hypothetical protein SAMN05421812_101736 [Asanoa hainanensis]|uniref:Uncharacterized protein n=1 Tax=Asanoa hainanensis TaxID=560556 RepID=A0A239H7P9_9ACTN|nr:hypothetical protein [Asanoa hainanensis]SNS77429.1 hypothetical protein SAMN05421812_101736 [Asanoa hainanensis]